MNIKASDNSFYLYKTKDFVTIDIRFYFHYENTKLNYLKAIILSKYLLRTNKKYKTMKEISDRSKELYESNILFNNKLLGTKALMCYELKMVNPRVIEEDYFTDAINFYKDILIQPNFNNNSLDKDIFIQIKKELLDNKKYDLNTPKILNKILFFKNVIPDSTFNNSNYSNIKEYEYLLNSINETDIITFYNDLLNNYVSSFAFGNLLDEEIKQIESLFKFKPIIFDYKYDHKDTIINKDIEITDKHTTESHIYFVYEIKDYKKENSYIYDVLTLILANKNGPVMGVYRSKLGIVYGAYASILYDNGVLFIEADIDKNNKEKAIQGLKEIFNILNDKKELTRLLQFAKDKKEELLISNSENIESQLMELENYVLKYDSLEEYKLKRINELTIEDIINQINNLEYKCMYYYKGDKYEK